MRAASPAGTPPSSYGGLNVRSQSLSFDLLKYQISPPEGPRHPHTASNDNTSPRADAGAAANAVASLAGSMGLKSGSAASSAASRAIKTVKTFSNLTDLDDLQVESLAPPLPPTCCGAAILAVASDEEFAAEGPVWRPRYVSVGNDCSCNGGQMWTEDGDLDGDFDRAENGERAFCSAWESSWQGRSSVDAGLAASPMFRTPSHANMARFPTFDFTASSSTASSLSTASTALSMAAELDPQVSDMSSSPGSLHFG